MGDISRGASTGFLWGVGFAVIGTLGFLSDGAAGEKLGFGLPTLLAIYLITGPILGALAGAAKRFVSSRLSAIAVGVVILLPVTAILYASMKGLTWTMENWPVIPIAALIFGVMGAFWFYDPATARKEVGAPAPSRLRSVFPRTRSKPDA